MQIRRLHAPTTVTTDRAAQQLITLFDTRNWQFKLPKRGKLRVNILDVNVPAEFTSFLLVWCVIVDFILHTEV